MKITTLVSLAGNPDAEYSMYQGYSKITLEAESISAYLEKIEGWFRDDIWHIISIEDVRFDAETEEFTENAIYIHRYSLN